VSPMWIVVCSFPFNIFEDNFFVAGFCTT
jgi:hypothetical protein